MQNARGVVYLLLGLGFFFVVPSRSSAQMVCSGSTTVIEWVNGVYRTGGNQVQSHLGTQIEGDYSDYWEASVTGYVTLTSLTAGTITIHPSVANSVGYGGNDVPGSGGTAAGYSYADAPSSVGGIGTWTVQTSHSAASECGESQTAQYTSTLVVKSPTISGLFGNGTYWNLGPGSNDPQETIGGAYYYQSVAITFETNCGADDVCSDTPHWSLTTSSNQAQLASTTGSTTTIKKGSSPGNCQFDSALTAEFGGLGTASYAIAFTSPTSMAKAHESTIAWGSGYITQWGLSVVDACHNVIAPVPISENFPSGFSLQNGATGYASPSISNGNYTDWQTNTYFYDDVGQSGNPQHPPVFFDKSGPPYTGNTVYLQGAHTWNAGSIVTGSGAPVYTGIIEYYSDHGANNP